MHISKTMLNMSGFAFEQVGLTADRKPVYGAPVELSSIWVAYTNAQTNGSNGKEPGDNGTLLFDVLNSSPAGFIPKIGMKIVVDDKSMTISSVQPGRGVNGIEHYECGMN